MERQDQFIERAFDAQIDAVFADVNDYQDRLHISQLAKRERSMRRMRKVQRRLVTTAEGLIVVGGLAAGGLLLSKAMDSDTTHAPTTVAPGESKEVELPTINPEDCDFSAAAQENPIIRIEEYRQCKANAQMGIEGLTSGN